MITKRAFLSTAAMAGTAAGFGLAARGRAQAANYPTRTIQFIMPFPAGPVDIVSRLYAQRMSQDWKQPVVVDSRPGATGSIGTDAVVKAAPDGYTLLFTVDLPITMAPNLLKVRYDPQRDLIPIASVAVSQNVLTVNASTGLRTVAELVAAAKSKPGVLTFSSAGIGSPAHLCGEMIKRQAGVDMIHVPYKGAGAATNALLAGDVTMFCGPIAQALPQIKAGKVNALAVAGERPSAQLPGVVTLASTYPGLVLSNWFGMLAPANTPADVCDALRNELKKISDDAQIRSRLLALGLEPTWVSGAELSRQIGSDLARWRDFIKAANIRTE